MTLTTAGSAISMATQEVIPQLKPKLLSMPGEIRNTIYRMVLTTQYQYNVHLGHDDYGRLHTALLRVNRQIHAEAIDILHGANIWTVARINTSERVRRMVAGQVPVLSPKTPFFIRHPALHIWLDVSIGINNHETQKEVSTFLLARESIQHFIRVLWMVTTRYPNRIGRPFTRSCLWLSLGASPFYSRVKLQSICLEPFGQVRTLSSITIESGVEPTVRQQLLSRMESPFTTLESILEIGNEYIQRGDDAHFRGDHYEAQTMFYHGRDFLSHARFSLGNHKHSKGIPFRSDDLQVLKTFRIVLGSRWTRSMLCLGCFGAVKDTFTMLLHSPGDITDVDHMNLILCKRRAQRGLNEAYDDHSLEGLAFVMRRDPRTLIQTYVETFPSAKNSPEAKWLKQAADLCTAREQKHQKAKDESVGIP